MPTEKTAKELAEAKFAKKQKQAAEARAAMIPISVAMERASRRF
jgi:hypothetical protein